MDLYEIAGELALYLQMNDLRFEDVVNDLERHVEMAMDNDDN